MNQFETVLIATLALSAVVSAQAETPAAAKPAVTGSRWHVDAMPKDENSGLADFTDALLFTETTVASIEYSRQGMAAAKFELAQTDGAWTLRTVLKGPQGTLHVSGMINGDKLAGSMTFKPKEGDVEEYGFSGLRAPALEASVWAAQLTSIDAEDATKAKPVPDTLTFASHKMTSALSKTGGFAVATFQLTPWDEGVWYLECEQRCAKLNQTKEWSGEVRGDTIKGTVTVLDEEGEVVSEHNFHAKRKPRS